VVVSVVAIAVNVNVGNVNVNVCRKRQRSRCLMSSGAKRPPLALTLDTVRSRL
jgi:hypothetical protein